MRLLLIAGLWLVSSVTHAVAQPAPTRSTRAADEAAVRDVVARYVAARELKDPRAVEALVTPDADQYTTGGEWRRGQAAIVEGTSRSSAQNPGTRAIRVEAVRFITPDVAIADGPYEIRSPAATAPARRMWTSIVVVRRANGWRITAIRNLAPTSASRPGR
jgi:uncharacterized protein (TIGR02246 family)